MWTQKYAKDLQEGEHLVRQKGDEGQVINVVSGTPTVVIKKPWGNLVRDFDPYDVVFQWYENKEDKSMLNKVSELVNREKEEEMGKWLREVSKPNMKELMITEDAYYDNEDNDQDADFNQKGVYWDNERKVQVYNGAKVEGKIEPLDLRKYPKKKAQEREDKLKSMIESGEYTIVEEIQTKDIEVGDTIYHPQAKWATIKGKADEENRIPVIADQRWAVIRLDERWYLREVSIEAINNE